MDTTTLRWPIPMPCGAGSVIRRDVPPGALAVSSGPQRNLVGWAMRRRPGTDQAAAAQAALAESSAADVQQADRPHDH